MTCFDPVKNIFLSFRIWRSILSIEQLLSGQHEEHSSKLLVL